ncbi:HTH_Tnp_Tc3_2 domain-containing protein, partial [Trichonephila clavipes]
RIARHVGESDAAIRRCWQEWVDNGRFQRHDGSSQPRPTACDHRLNVQQAVPAPDSSLSTIRRVTRIRVATITIHRQLIERNSSSYQPLRDLPLTPAHCRARLQWCSARSCWNHADWGCTTFSVESRFQPCPDNHRRRVWRRVPFPDFTIARHSGPQPEVMVRGAISFNSRTPLVVIIDHLQHNGRKVHRMMIICIQAPMSECESFEAFGNSNSNIDLEGFM